MYWFGLPRNVETLDSRIRLVLGFALTVGVLQGEVLVGDPMWVLAGAYFVITGIIRYDPFYYYFFRKKKITGLGEDLMDQ
jgi:hypothetical protein